MVSIFFVYFCLELVIVTLNINNVLSELSSTLNQSVPFNHTCAKYSTLSEYYKERNAMLFDELSSSFGSEVKLNEREEIANKIIMSAKEDEIRIGVFDPHQFNPSRHIFEVLDDIKRSKLFQIIQKIPKGGILHVHMKSMCSVDFVVYLTYWPNLWQRTIGSGDAIEEFRFSYERPTTNGNDNSIWRLVEEVRNSTGAMKYDAQIRSLFTLFDKNVNPRLQFNNTFDAWKPFTSISAKLGQIIEHAPAFKAYHKQAFKEMLEDGVQYVEIRGSLKKFTDIDGKLYDEEDIVSLMIEAVDEFSKENPSFIGAKFIFSGGKRYLAKLDSYFATVRRFHSKYPDFLAGFDLDYLEDVTPRLVSFAERVLQLPDDLKLFFHAGETNWFGGTDENLFDAILLGSRRIGHGYALAKHPKLVNLVKSKDIAVEVNPISNQVLRLVHDFRNHPASILMAQNVSVVISSDNPGFWGVTPLSHDFYIAFLGITSRHSDLRTIKKFAINSIQYSSMKKAEKHIAFAKWQIEWDKFIENLIQDNNK